MKKKSFACGASFQRKKKLMVSKYKYTPISYININYLISAINKYEYVTCR